MGWSKRELITAAYENIGMANYVFDLEPEQLQSACRAMDAMIAAWPVNIRYNSSDSPSTADINEDSGLPSFANEAVYLNLAMKLAMLVGKNVSVTLGRSAMVAYLNMVNKMSTTKEMRLPNTLARGAGSKNLGSPFITTEEQLQTGPEGDLDFIE